LAAELPPSKEQTAAATGPGRAITSEDMPNFVAPEQEISGNGNSLSDRQGLSEALAGLAPSMTMPSPALPTTARPNSAANTGAAITNASPEANLRSGFASTTPETNARSGFASTNPETNVRSGFASTNPETNVRSGFASTNPETRTGAGYAANPTAGSVSSFAGAAAASPAFSRPNRIAITPERFLAALQPKIEKAAETAILAAVNKHLAPALHAAVNSIDAAREASVQQVSNASAQQRSALVHTSKEEVLARVEDRLDEVRTRWDSQLEGYRIRAEEIVQRIDRQAGAAQKNLGEAREVSERALRDTQQKIASVIAESLSGALEEFNRGVAQASDRYLTNFMEEAQSLTREATAHLESNVAEARATVQTAASEALGEFRRQAEIHATVTATDTTQRVTSALTALDAEHRAVCDNRRKSIESDVARSTEQITEQFRQGLRAFFYSCLVAAVGAVEQHSQSTREGFALDPKNFLPPEIK
jgi:hypothetical protein